MRHLVNCSDALEYDKRIAELRQTLRTRGYPECVMPSVPFDPDKRQQYLERYRNRALYREKPQVLKIVTNYSESLRHLKLRARADQLLSRLRAQLGSDFLSGARVFVAHQVQASLFRSSYPWNFLVE